MKERKDDKYKKEQEEILIKIIRKIGISKDKRRFNREELERETIKDYINEMLDEIKRYYKMSNWRSIKNGKK
jgi:ribosomal protein L13E